VEIDSNREKAETFSSFFASVFTREDTCNLPTVHKRCSVELSDNEISEGQVLDLLRHLQPDTSPGSGGLHSRVLKECAEFLLG